MKTPQSPTLAGTLGYDIIGDIHGHAALLREMLNKLGYENLDGSWQHPSRRAVFIGDFIDRGPAIVETLDLVMHMVLSGSALAVLGNHELAALLYDFDPKGHSHLKSQLESTHTQFQGRETEWQRCMAWFRSLSFALDLGSFRVVHACWNDDAVKTLQSLASPLDNAALRLLSDSSSRLARAAEVLLNGLRLVLPGDLFVMTGRGMPLNWMRAKWWLPVAGSFYDDLAFPDLDVVPRKPVTLPEAEFTGLYAGYPAAAPCVFNGHYSLPAQATPSPMTGNVACVDYSVWKKGPLIAYRWDGEQNLSAEKFVSTVSNLA